MEADRYLPTGWHWKITPEQIAKIKANDRATINEVYLSNYAKFIRIAKNYCRRVKRSQFWIDCVNQIYVDLPLYNYSDTNSLYLSMKRSFRYACGFPKNCYNVCVLSLDLPVYGDDGDDDLKTLGELIGVTDTTDEERHAEDKHVLQMIAAQTQLSENERDCLTAFAFNCRVYAGLFRYEYEQVFAV